LVVHPAHRGHGLGRALLQATIAEAGEEPVRLWAHGDLPAAAALAASTGLSRARALWRMTRSLHVPLAEPRLAPGVSVRTFVPGQDEPEWLTLNGRAFADHPEQGRWTREDIDLRESEPWFDPAGFFLAERGGRLVGFHWTKIHPAGPAPAGPRARGRAPVGEVYVLGVDPEDLVQFLRRERMVTRGNGAENLCVKLNLVERHTVVDTKIETLTHRSPPPSLGRSAANPLVQGYAAARRPRMTQQGHSRTTSGRVLLVPSITIPINRPRRVHTHGKGSSSHSLGPRRDSIYRPVGSPGPVQFARS